MRPGQFSCRLLVLPQVDLPTQDSSLAIECLSNTQASLLGSNIAAVFPIAAREFTLYLCVCVSVYVCLSTHECVCVCVCECVLLTFFDYYVVMHSKLPIIFLKYIY